MMLIHSLLIITISGFHAVFAGDDISSDFDTQLKVLSARLNESKISKATRIINRVPKAEQPHFVEQILKLSQKSPKGSMGLEALDILSKIHASEREDAVNQYLRLITPDDTNHENVLKVAQALSRLNADVRSQFVDFVLHNGVINIDQILELIQTSIEDWVDALQGFRNILEDMQENYGNRHILGLHNQTVHDAAYEDSLTESVTKLSSRYSTSVADLEAILNFYLNKIDDLVSKKLISETEAQIVRHFFSAGLTTRRIF